ncbi:MAG: cytochrome c biogenesis protein CcsA [Myxococcota bacterium]
MTLLLLKCCVVFYLVVAILGLVQLRWPRLSGDRTVIIGLGLAVAVHGLALILRTLELAELKELALQDGLSLFGFLAGVIAIGIARKNIPQAAPLAAVLITGIVFIAVWGTTGDQVPVRLRSPWLPVHIATAVLGEASFAVAGLVAAVYLIQERRLKQKKKIAKTGTGLHKLPALELLDNVSVRLVLLGFPMMTIGLLAGAIYGKEVSGQYWTWGLLNTVSVTVWGLFALLLHFRLTIGWRGRKAALLTLVGVMATVLVMAGLALAGVGAHGSDYVS